MEEYGQSWMDKKKSMNMLEPLQRLITCMDGSCDGVTEEGGIIVVCK